MENRILSALPRAEYRELQPNLERIDLTENEVVFSHGDRIEFIYFPENAIVSHLLDVDGRRTVEVAMEGNESAVGFAASLGGTHASNHSIVRNAGTAMRMDVGVLTRSAGRLDQLEALLARYVHAFLAQVAQEAVCSRFHNIDKRLARWLLMSGDRVGSDGLHATHESIARLLGVRRSSVSIAARTLNEQGVIAYSRGHIMILDPARLLDASCSCYGIIKRQFDSFLDA